MNHFAWLVFLAGCSSSGALHASAPAATAGAMVAEKSQVGAAPDGAFHADAQGHFLPDADARRAFDWVLAASGEAADAALETRLNAAIAAQLHAPADAEARSVLQSYLAYRAAGAQLPHGTATASARIAAISALRQQFFDAKTHQGLFGDEEQRATVAIAEQAVHANGALADADKSAQLAALDAQLPAGDVAARTAAQHPLQIFQNEATLRANGDGDDSVYAQRLQAFGSDGAARLAALDAEQASFAATVAALRSMRDQMNEDGRSAQAVATALTQAVAAQVPALEQAHATALLAQ
jgi:lipase chaperone LimK